MERGLAHDHMSDHEFAVPACCPPTVAPDPFAQFPSEEGKQNQVGHAPSESVEPLLLTGFTSEDECAAASLPKDDVAPSAIVSAPVGRSTWEWLRTHGSNAAIAVIGFACAVVIVSARLSVIVSRRSAWYARHTARAFSMFTSETLRTVATKTRQISPPVRSRARAILHRDIPYPVSALRRYAYPTVFMSGVAVGVLMMVGRAPSDEVEAAPVATSTRTDVALAADIRSLPAPPSRGDEAVPTSGIDSRAALRGRSRTPARVVPAAEPEDDTWSPGTFRGSVAVGSRPEGAEVFVNGQSVGRTPLVLRDLRIGSRAVRVTLDGHQSWSRAVQVVANQRTTVTATLERSGSN